MLRTTILLIALAILGGCARETEIPSSIEGVFRTRDAITAPERNPPLYFEYHFAKTGVVEIKVVEKSGRDSGRPGGTQRFILEGRKIKVSPFQDLGPGGLFCGPNLTVESRDRLIVDNSPYVLIRKNE